MTDQSTVPVETGEGDAHSAPPRRRILVWLSSFGMVGGLVAAYGTLAGYIGRFLYPARPTDQGWMFVSELAGLEEGTSLAYRTPGGAPVNITRLGSGVDAAAFVALSSTCPHLGCQVAWEAQNDRYFCPCHNGVFDPTGKAIEGPPAEAGQSLLQYPLRVADGMLFIQVPLERLAQGERPAGTAPRRRVAGPAGSGPPGPGHDPCLYPETCGRGAKRA